MIPISFVIKVYILFRLIRYACFLHDVYEDKRIYLYKGMLTIDVLIAVMCLFFLLVEQLSSLS